MVSISTFCGLGLLFCLMATEVTASSNGSISERESISRSNTISLNVRTAGLIAKIMYALKLSQVLKISGKLMS